MNVIKMNNENVKALNGNMENVASSFIFKENEDIIGYGIIKDSTVAENRIIIFVYEKFRGNGYGSKVFKLLIDELCKMNEKELIFIIEQSNICFRKILLKHHAIDLGMSCGFYKYVLPLNERL